MHLGRRIRHGSAKSTGRYEEKEDYAQPFVVGNGVRGQRGYCIVKEVEGLSLIHI